MVLIHLLIICVSVLYNVSKKVISWDKIRKSSEAGVTHRIRLHTKEGTWFCVYTTKNVDSSSSTVDLGTYTTIYVSDSSFYFRNTLRVNSNPTFPYIINAAFVFVTLNSLKYQEDCLQPLAKYLIQLVIDWRYKTLSKFSDREESYLLLQISLNYCMPILF
jgi:hypothetical protein